MHRDKLEDNRMVNIRNKWFKERAKNERAAYGNNLARLLLAEIYDVTVEREAPSG